MELRARHERVRTKLMRGRVVRHLYKPPGWPDNPHRATQNMMPRWFLPDNVFPGVRNSGLDRSLPLQGPEPGPGLGR